MYSTLDVAYNDNTEILDKMARDLNNKKIIPYLYI